MRIFFVVDNITSSVQYVIKSCLQVFNFDLKFSYVLEISAYFLCMQTRPHFFGNL